MATPWMLREAPQPNLEPSNHVLDPRYQTWSLRLAVAAADAAETASRGLKTHSEHESSSSRSWPSASAYQQGAQPGVHVSTGWRTAVGSPWATERFGDVAQPGAPAPDIEERCVQRDLQSEAPFACRGHGALHVAGLEHSTPHTKARNPIAHHKPNAFELASTAELRRPNNEMPSDRSTGEESRAPDGILALGSKFEVEPRLATNRSSSPIKAGQSSDEQKSAQELEDMRRRAQALESWSRELQDAKCKEVAKGHYLEIQRASATAETKRLEEEIARLRSRLINLETCAMARPIAMAQEAERALKEQHVAAAHSVQQSPTTWIQSRESYHVVPSPPLQKNSAEHRKALEPAARRQALEEEQARIQAELQRMHGQQEQEAAERHQGIGSRTLVDMSREPDSVDHNFRLVDLGQDSESYASGTLGGSSQDLAFPWLASVGKPLSNRRTPVDIAARAWEDHAVSTSVDHGGNSSASTFAGLRGRTSAKDSIDFLSSVKLSPEVSIGAAARLFYK